MTMYGHKDKTRIHHTMACTDSEKKKKEKKEIKKKG